MKAWAGVVALAVMLGLSGCGGGGSGGDVATSVSLSVAVNGTPATADSAGQYSVKPGDTVELTSSVGADWSAAAASGNAVTLRNASTTTTGWKAQLVNNETVQNTYTVTAQATGNASVTKQAVLTVGAADGRNGTYKVWATNGTQQQLALNFDTHTYDMTDAAGAVLSDSFAGDASEAGTFIFKSARISNPVNTARFRVTSDAVVGSFPVESPQAAGTYAVQPFIGSRDLITKQSDLDGAYNRLGVNYSTTTRDSQIRQVEVSAGGTVFKQCNEVAIYSVANCPPASVMTYTVSAGSSASNWSYVNVADANDKASFTVARVAGQKVILAAGSDTTGLQRAFRLGIIESGSWPVTTAKAGDTNGTWGTLMLGSTTGTSSFAKADGSSGSVSHTFFSITPAGPNGILGSGTAPNSYFGMQNGKLSVIVGARGNNGGYMQFGLVE